MYRTMWYVTFLPIHFLLMLLAIAGRRRVLRVSRVQCTVVLLNRLDNIPSQFTVRSDRHPAG